MGFCGYGNDTCLNLTTCRHYMTNDIILPWKESWWKVAAGWQLPTGGCRALWLEKYFFHWSPEPFSFCISCVKVALFIRLQTVCSLFSDPVFIIILRYIISLVEIKTMQRLLNEIPERSTVRNYSVWILITIRPVISKSPVGQNR